MKEGPVNRPVSCVRTDRGIDGRLIPWEVRNRDLSYHKELKSDLRGNRDQRRQEFIVYVTGHVFGHVFNGRSGRGDGCGGTINHVVIRHERAMRSITNFVRGMEQLPPRGGIDRVSDPGIRH